MGSNTTYGYFYKPSLGASGAAELALYDAALDATDIIIKANVDGLAAKQPLDAGLTSIAALTTAADKMIYTTALDTYAVASLTAFARTILDDADAAAVRATIGVGTGTVDTSGTPVDNDFAKFTDEDTIEGRSYSEVRTDLGLVVGTNVQAYDAQLADIAALAVTNGNFIVGDGANWVAESGATARTSLGLTIGTHVQAYDAALASVSGLVYVSPSFIKLTADDTYAVRTLAETLTDIGGAALQGVEAIGAVTFNDGTHILSVATITYWVNGATYTTANPTTCDIDSFETLTDNTLYYFAFDDATGTLKCSDTDWNFTTQVMVATVFWNGTNGAIQKEWHNHTRNIAWHKWAHDTIGARYEAGLSLTAPTTAADATLTIESGSIKDEDLEITISQQSTCRIIYKASASIYTWVDSSLPYAGSSADPKWLDTDNYTLTSVGNSDFVCMWVYATNDADRHIYIIPTHAADAHNIIAQARAETAPVLSDLNLNPEMKLIYRFIYKGDGQFQESNDYRLTSPLPSGGSASTNASAVSFSPSGNIAATTVQTALEEVDAEKAKIGANTDITSILNTSLYVGRDADNQIKFASDNTIVFRLNGADGASFISTGEFDMGAHSVGFTIQTLTGSTPDDIDWKLGNYMKFTHGAEATQTFTFTAPSNPCALTLQIKQDSVGGRDITFPAAVKWLMTEPTWTDGGANKTIIMSMRYDGTDYWCNATSWEA